MTTPNTNVGEAKFTPGPWAAFNTFGKDIYPKDGDMEALRHIAELCPEGFENDRCVITYEEAKANAHLIASAPQMFEALERSLQFIKGHCKNQLTWSDIDERIEEVLGLARGEAHESRGESEGGE